MSSHFPSLSPVGGDNDRYWSRLVSFRNRRYEQVRVIPDTEGWRAVPFDMPPPPDRDAVLERIGQIVGTLADAIDEGTGAALDRLIESWLAGWVAAIEAEFADHVAVVSVHRARAMEVLTLKQQEADRERRELEHARADYLACRARLGAKPADGDTAPGAQA